MSFANEEEFNSFIGRDHILPHVTTEAVAESMGGFSLQLIEDRDMDWLATAVRRSLAIVSRSADVSEMVSPSKTRAKMEGLASTVDETWKALFECDSEVDARIWAYACFTGDGEIDAVLDGELFGDPSDYLRFHTIISELSWLARFLRTSAAKIESRRGSWRQSMVRALRIERALLMAPIFEVAFGQRVSANNFPSDARHKAPTPFMDFYDRMTTLAFGLPETTNLAEVVKIACQVHREAPAQFAPDLIPRL